MIITQGVQYASTAVTMKLILGLYAILAIISLGQAHQFPNFGRGPLHEDFQDILDLVPADKIIEVAVDYLINDNEVQDFFDELENSTIIQDFLAEFKAIPEVTNLVNYLRDEGINFNNKIKSFNEAFDIKEFVPPSYELYSLNKRTGGLRGLFIDIKKLFDYDVFLSIYVDKLKVSTVFVNFINQLKSDNFQQIVNKVSNIKAFQLIVNRLKDNSINLKIGEDILYLVLGISVPGPPPKTLAEELLDFIKLIPGEKFLDIVIKYINEDKKLQEAALFLFTTEFHDLLRALEATKEHQALVIYLEKAGIPIIEALQRFHHAIGMDKYVPPKIENYVRSLIKTQKIGEGMAGLLKDLYDILPLDKIDALYQHKRRTSKVFVDFISKITSKEMIKILNDIAVHKAYKEFITKTMEKGLDFEAAQNFGNRIIGIKPFY